MADLCRRVVWSLVGSFIPWSWQQPIWAFYHVAFKGKPPRGACCEHVENDSFLSALPASNVSVWSSRRKPTCSMSCCKVTEKSDEGVGGSEFCSLSGVLYGSVHLTCECTPDTSVLALTFFAGFSLSFLGLMFNQKMGIHAMLSADLKDFIGGYWPYRCGSEGACSSNYY